MEDLSVDVKANSPVERLRHSAAHIMAQAVKRHFPEAQFGVGPTIEDGFYYDILTDRPLTVDDLPKIEEEMRKIAQSDFPFERENVARAKAKDLFDSLGQKFKLELIDGIADAEVGVYRQGEFTDLCRGPHLERTGGLKHFKLLKVAGAYWRGDEKNAQLTRIYGTAFLSKAELDEHLHLLEEAKKRDHRKLGQELELFFFNPIAPAQPFFLPKGAQIYQKLQDLIRDYYRNAGYQEVITPQLFDVGLWKQSGHYDNYKENMYFVEVENREFSFKPMNCPSHTYVFGSKTRSYRDLPLRIADFGRLHRFERSGVIHGLTRVRGFCQDDAHIFCTQDQVGAEVAELISIITYLYGNLGFNESKIYLSTRPEKRIGSDEVWDAAEGALTKALEANNQKYEINAGDGAFYGPKIDFNFRDALKRYHQLATIQLDFNLPERFNLSYIDADNKETRPIMIHRAILGSLERFIGVLLEHTGGAFPFWLAPTQVRIIPVNEAHQDYAKKLIQDLEAKDIRVEMDDRNESLGKKTREAQMMKIPVMLVVGQKEVDTQAVSWRDYGAKQAATMPWTEALDRFYQLAKMPEMRSK